MKTLFKLKNIPQEIYMTNEQAEQEFKSAQVYPRVVYSSDTYILNFREWLDRYSIKIL